VDDPFGILRKGVRSLVEGDHIGDADRTLRLRIAGDDNGWHRLADRTTSDTRHNRNDERKETEDG
jgi:hypothetical protein